LCKYNIKKQNTAKYLFEIGFKWQNKGRGSQLPLEVTGEYKHKNRKWTDRIEKITEIELLRF
jgi:hypothetical protein